MKPKRFPCQVNVSLSTESKAKLEEISIRENISVAEMVRGLIEKKLKASA
jgi:hypothetical protein